MGHGSDVVGLVKRDVTGMSHLDLQMSHPLFIKAGMTCNRQEAGADLLSSWIHALDRDDGVQAEVNGIGTVGAFRNEVIFENNMCVVKVYDGAT